MRTPYDYGAWWSYVFPRLDGLELVDVGAPRDRAGTPLRRPGELVLASFGERRDWNLFADAYADPDGGVALPPTDFQVRSPGLPRRRSPTSAMTPWLATSPT